MKLSTTFFLSIIAATIGMFFFTLKHEFIILRIPGYHLGILPNQGIANNHKKMITLFARSRDTWRTEQEELIWTNDTAANMQLLMKKLADF